MGESLAGPCATCGPCSATSCPCIIPLGTDFCGCCGGTLEVTLDITCVDFWEISGFGSKARSGISCGCETGIAADGTGPTTGVQFQIRGLYWQEIPDNCCVNLSCNFSTINWIDESENISCVFTPDTDDGLLDWPFIDGGADSFFDYSTDTGHGLNACCNCDSFISGGKEVSVFFTDISTSGWVYVIGEEVAAPNDCAKDLCIWNRHDVVTSQNYSFEYTSIINSDCCTEEPTGTTAGRTRSDLVIGVAGYQMSGFIDGLVTNIDGYTIIASGARDLQFRFQLAANNDTNFMGRIDVVIEGEKCDNSLVTTDIFTAASYWERDTNPCQSCEIDRVVTGGGIGQWAPDLSSDYKRFKVTMTAKGWDWAFAATKGCGSIANPVTEPTHGAAMATTVAWITIDPSFYTCP